MTRLADPALLDVTRLPGDVLGVTRLPTGGVDAINAPIESGSLLGYVIGFSASSDAAAWARCTSPMISD